ncbi:hypothetical protein TcasGA2_TC034304 [Tribolium castaneum]|uniref:Uncharacterized protein n=1 Tax=Tribolium castaneum TaxID=7070 RepID=A0A139WC85_TRICA|nr:hypothetical protein TcasGA2_TC034304 [Tribolium castaneum]
MEIRTGVILASRLNWTTPSISRFIATISLGILKYV